MHCFYFLLINQNWGYNLCNPKAVTNPQNSLYYPLPVSRYWANARWRYFYFLDFWSIPKGSLTKHDKRNTAASKKLMMTSCQQICDVIVIFFIYGQFGAIWKLDSGCMVCKLGTCVRTYKIQVSSIILTSFR